MGFVSSVSPSAYRNPSLKSKTIHRRHILHELENCAKHSSNVLSLIEEPVSLGEGHRSHDVKGEELKPFPQIKNLHATGEALVKIHTHAFQDSVNKPFERRRASYGENRRNWFLHLVMQSFILYVEYRLQSTPTPCIRTESCVKVTLQ